MINNLASNNNLTNKQKKPPLKRGENGLAPNKKQKAGIKPKTILLNKKNKKPLDEKEVLKKYDDLINKEQEKRKNGASSLLEKNKIDILKDKILSFLKKEKKESSRLLDINLVKEEVTTFIDWQENINFLIICIIVSLSLVGFLYMLVIFIQVQKISRNSMYVGQIADLRQEQINAERGVEEIISFQKKLDLASDLLKKHIYWTNFFDFLEKNTLTDVYYSGIRGDTDGKYFFNAHTSSFSSITEQVKVLRDNPYVVEVNVSGGNVVGGDSIRIGEKNDNVKMETTEGIDFDINITLDKSIFSNKYEPKDK